MAKTAAEKQKEYRARQKVTQDGNGNAPIVTVTPSPRVTVTELDKPTFDDVLGHIVLPADVQASIDRMCSENNDGDRAETHSRELMTRRALAYQAMFGRRVG